MADPIPIELPPGFYGNGTPYTAAGRFSTGNLVRFLNGYVRPLQGWRKRKDQGGVEVPKLFPDPSVEAARNIIQWQDNLGGAHIVVGTNKRLVEIGQTGTVTDITPAGFVPGNKSTAEIVGYGIGRYGREAYGTPRSGLGFQLKPVASWSFSMFGEILLAQFRGTGPLYKWQPGVDAKAVAVAAAPQNAQAVLVTAERITMLIFEQPRKVQWSDRETFDVWTPTITNTAGDQTLAGIGKLVEITQVGRDILINSTGDAWLCRFLGAPYIYGFEEAGKGCGCGAANSVVASSGRAYWFAPRGGWWIYDGTVKKLLSDIDDWHRDVISLQQVSKMSGFELPSTREIVWFFQSTADNDCDYYVLYGFEDGWWAYGRLDRTTGMAQSPTNFPMYVGRDGQLWDHEVTGLDIPTGYQDFAETGPLELQGGGQIMGVQYIYPDLTPEAPSAGTLALPRVIGPDTAAQLEILGKDWPSPGEAERTYGPYPLDRPIPTTGVRGREIRLRYKGTGGGRWRGGKQRMQVVGLGER